MLTPSPSATNRHPQVPTHSGAAGVVPPAATPASRRLLPRWIMLRIPRTAIEAWHDLHQSVTIDIVCEFWDQYHGVTEGEKIAITMPDEGYDSAREITGTVSKSENHAERRASRQQALAR